MESLSIADLTEMVLMVSNAQDDQFQYWLSISFAVIVASFIAKEKITERLKIVGPWITSYREDTETFTYLTKLPTTNLSKFP